MTATARTPEELDTLIEDAFLQQDLAAFADLFEDAAVLTHAGGAPARGRTEVGEAIAALWGRQWTYVARPRHVLQSRDIALVVADAGIHVLRRGGDGAWRSAISFLDLAVPGSQITSPSGPKEPSC